MKSGGATGLIIGIRPKLEGAALHRHADQQQRRGGARVRAAEHAASSYLALTLLPNTLWPRDPELIANIILIAIF